ncbi:MAG: hypothetical protein KC431_01455, partial [Myxococcales bacterium]|nr:hypothetical protein [Myxococcales bacterium]
MAGHRVGFALEYFNERYAEMASDLTVLIEESEYADVDPYEVANAWTASNDARGYAVLGDPAVCLRFAEPGVVRERIEIPTPTAATPSVDAPEASAETSSEEPTSGGPAGAVNFGWFGGSKDKSDDAEDDATGESGERTPAPPSPSKGAFAGALEKVTSTLGRVLEDATTLEVRTYVSANPGLAAAADRQTLAQDGDLRAFTRIAIDGDMDVIIPQRDGAIDRELWELHLQLVKQAQEGRARTLEVIVAAFTGAIKR